MTSVCPHVVAIDPKSPVLFKFTANEFRLTSKEVRQWLAGILGPGHYWYWAYDFKSIHFECQADALLFKLTWGGDV